MLLPITRNNESDKIQDACRIVAEHYYGDRGLWCYRAFDWINRTLFFDELPPPLIVITLTPHGHCLALTHWALDRPPVIRLHPSLWGGTEKATPWGIDADQLGPRYALDVLIHESTHVSVRYRLGGPTRGDSFHNNPEWMSEVNRIAPLLGLIGINAAMSKVKRDGKKVRRVCEGNIPL